MFVKFEVFQGQRRFFYGIPATATRLAGVNPRNGAQDSLGRTFHQKVQVANHLLPVSEVANRAPHQVKTLPMLSGQAADQSQDRILFRREPAFHQEVVIAHGVRLPAFSRFQFRRAGDGIDKPVSVVPSGRAYKSGSSKYHYDPTSIESTASLRHARVSVWRMNALRDGVSTWWQVRRAARKLTESSKTPRGKALYPFG